MKSQQILFAVALLTLMGAATAGEGDAPSAHAESLHQENCIRCHDQGIYTREGRLITSLDGLEGQVRRCETALGLTWFDEDIKDVAFYLNHHFYRFGR